MTGRIFLHYRRDDAKAGAARLHGWLSMGTQGMEPERRAGEQARSRKLPREPWKFIAGRVMAAALALVLFQPPPAASGAEPPAAQEANTNIYKLLGLFGEVLERVRTEYIEKPDDKILIENAINGMLQGLNPPALSMPAPPRYQGDNTDIYRLLDRFGTVLEQVRTQYVLKPDDKILIENAINGMLHGLDPHSGYIPPKEFEMMPAASRAEAAAAPTPIQIPQKEFVVVPAKPSAGVDAAANPKQVRVMREVIRINPVKFSAEDDVGWVKIKSFQDEHTYDYTKLAIDNLKKSIGPKLKGYVIDLRNNPGGLLNQALAVADAFLDNGAIVLTKGRKTSDMSRALAKPGDIAEEKPIVVLINGGSASASEIVAGALQDCKRATVMGTRSFGMGTIQTLIPLSPGGALRLTTARFYTPSGRSIQAAGIVPDYIVEPELPENLKQQIGEAKGEAGLPGHLAAEGGSEAEAGISYVPGEREKDVQLKAAIDLLHGKKST